MNPFIVDQHIYPECFIGRKALIKTAFNQIRNRSSLAIWGGTGMGKSSFLELLRFPPIWEENGLDAAQALIILFDCQSIEPFQPNIFWRNLLEKIKKSFPALTQELQLALSKEHNKNDDLENLLSKLGKYNKHLVLLIDNYDVVLRSNSNYTDSDIKDFVRTFRSITHSEKTREYISIIVTSSRRLSDIAPQLTYDSSPWFNQYLFRHLKPFSEKEVNSLLDQSENLLPWEKTIRKIADGHPALLQNACYLLYEELQAENSLNISTFIREFQSATLHIFQTIWQLSTEDEQSLLMLLALVKLKGKLGKNGYNIRGIEIVLSQKEVILNGLVERGILKAVEEEEKTTYLFCSSIMEWWVIKKIENSQKEELTQRKKGWGNLMSRQQKQRVNQAISWIWKNQEKIASIVEQLGD